LGRGQLPHPHVNGISNNKCYGTICGDCPFFVSDTTSDPTKWTITKDAISSGRRNIDSNGLCTDCLNL
jgi:hypothetical protein